MSSSCKQVDKGCKEMHACHPVYFLLICVENLLILFLKLFALVTQIFFCVSFRVFYILSSQYTHLLLEVMYHFNCNLLYPHCFQFEKPFHLLHFLIIGSSAYWKNTNILLIMSTSLYFGLFCFSHFSALITFPGSVVLCIWCPLKTNFHFSFRSRICASSGIHGRKLHMESNLVGTFTHAPLIPFCFPLGNATIFMNGIHLQKRHCSKSLISCSTGGIASSFPILTSA